VSQTPLLGQMTKTRVAVYCDSVAQSWGEANRLDFPCKSRTGPRVDKSIYWLESITLPEAWPAHWCQRRIAAGDDLTPPSVDGATGVVRDEKWVPRFADSARNDKLSVDGVAGFDVSKINESVLLSADWQSAVPHLATGVGL
jgi:hypothetical protein